MTRARRWLEPCSTAAAYRNTSFATNPSAGRSCRTRGCPTVTVPVLSNTATVAAASRSSAAPCRMMICRRAARFIPPMMATGAARISGQGVATTRIASTRSESCVANQAPTHAAMVAGVNQTAYLSARRWSGALLDCAVRTSSTMRAYWLSEASAEARSRSTPVPLRVPLITSVPGSAFTGAASPVSAATFRSDCPSTTSPSHGTRSPGRTMSRSPTTISPTGTSSTRSPEMRCAIRGAASSSARTAADARPSAQCSSPSPPVCISTMTSPASGCTSRTAPTIASEATMSVAK